LGSGGVAFSNAFSMAFSVVSCGGVGAGLGGAKADD